MRGRVYLKKHLRLLEKFVREFEGIDVFAENRYLLPDGFQGVSSFKVMGFFKL